MKLIVGRIRWLLFFTNDERNQIRQGLRSGNGESKKLLKELG